MEISIQDFLAIGVVGAGVSTAIDIIKVKYGTSPYKTKLVTILLSVLVGSGYYFLRETQAFVTVVGVLVSASTFYAFFLKK